MKRAKGFTLVELVIVIVIVGILSIVAVPIYRGYTRKAMASEGKALLGTIQTAEKVYFAEYATFKPLTTETGYDTELDVDARSNKYFTSFTITTNGSGSGATYTAITTGNGGASGIALSVETGSQKQPKYTDTGLNA
ncbi:MAG: prepilin-type N-terminal cleavage/methylation domain-containing protein [Elusimicrobia bacterium]|nr:prepilin-type N-terminal cleavage/methylation domain-containing protein [Elusimicrobiota bacterium]